MTKSGADRGPVADARVLRRVEHAVARILAETERPVEVYEATLGAIGRPIGWPLGAVWELDPEGESLRCVRTWRAGEAGREFQRLSEALALAPGEGLPGRVLASGEPAWLVDAPEDANFPRAAAARRDGLHAGFGFPLRSPRGVVGVMEFFARDPREPDERLLATMAVLGSQVGQFVARRRAEEEVRARESRLRAMLEAALDAVVSMDAHGRVIGWNHAAEAIFGYQAREATGREMAELIVPPRLRDRHRRGLARFLESRRGVVLDRRLELTGMRRDGSEFPVELTITHIALPGAPTFTGYLRDITDRVTADRELRASRARLVEVADAERRRIQRNLHDGAQQRLTSALLSLGRIRASSDEHAALLELAIEELATGLQEIRELAGGLHPSMLTERGLATALQALAMRAPLPVELEALPDARLPEQVEAAAYYVVAEALANVQKHASAGRVAVSATADADRLAVVVSDDGVGGADAQGAGLRGLADRVEALDGRLTVESPRGAGTRLAAEIPLGAG
jgi:PAS domain S-box-containing protein